MAELGVGMVKQLEPLTLCQAIGAKGVSGHKVTELTLTNEPWLFKGIWSSG